MGHIPLCHGAGVGIRSINQDLDGRTGFISQIPGETGGDFDCDHGRSAIQCLHDLTLGQRVGDREVPGGGQRLHEVSRRGRTIPIDHDGADIAHIGADRISEQQELNDRRHEDEGLHAGIAKHLPQLLPQKVADAVSGDSHHAISLRNRCVARPRPTAAKTTMARTCSHSTGSPTPLRKMPLVTVMKYRAGTSNVRIRNGAGMFAIENMNPDSRSAGR